MTKLTRRTTTGLLIAGSLMPSALMAQGKKKKKKKGKKSQGYERPPIKYPELAALLVRLATDKLGPGFNGTLSVIAMDSFKVKGRDSVCDTNRALRASGRKERHCRRGIDYKKDKGKVAFEAVIRLQWDPGMRQRPVVSNGATDEDAFFALVDATVDTFSSL